MAREYEVTYGRVVKAFFVAALLGGLIVIFLFIIGLSFMGGFSAPTRQNILFFIEVYVIAAFFWGVGLVLLGGPVWALMHKLKLYQWYHAALAGAFILSATTFSFAGFSGSWFFVCIGSVMGFIVWRIAYRKKE